MAPAGSDLGQALVDLMGAFMPLRLRDLQAEIDERLAKLPNRINEFGFDAYGLSPEWLRRMALPGVLLYRYYFRGEALDIERIPAGRVLLVANHAGQLPFDGLVLTAALLMDAEPPRIARPMAEFFVSRLPWLGTVMSRGGAMVGTPSNCIHMLENEECVMVFPEGVRGISKPYRQRYQLQRFGLGFMRLALETHTPIVPVAVIGAEEQAPAINLKTVARLVGAPSFPIVPYPPFIPLVPLPVKYRLYFGEAMTFTGDPDDDDDILDEKVRAVKRRIESMVHLGLQARKHVFW